MEGPHGSTSSDTDIQGLREQIFSNAIVIFSKASQPFMHGSHVPHQIFDIILVRRPRAPIPPPPAAPQGLPTGPPITHDWCAYLIHGPVHNRVMVASGGFRPSKEEALQGLLEFLADKIVPGQHFDLPQRPLEFGSGCWDQALLGPHDMPIYEG